MDTTTKNPLCQHILKSPTLIRYLFRLISFLYSPEYIHHSLLVFWGAGCMFSCSSGLYGLASVGLG